MRIAHDALVVVADGAKSLFFLNEGDEEYLNLVVQSHRTHDDRPDRDIKTDAPGRAVSSVGSGRSSLDEPDYHQQAEDRFASAAADQIDRMIRGLGIEDLIVVAPPHTLGELRRHYSKDVSDRIVVEIDKDLTNHPVDRIEEVLKAV
jgi:protein required for attachment to host cells